MCENKEVEEEGLVDLDEGEQGDLRRVSNRVMNKIGKKYGVNTQKTKYKVAAQKDAANTPSHSRKDITSALRKMSNEEYDLDERTLSTGEMKQRENIVKSMKKSYGDFRKRYGEKAKSVMYATATKMAKEDIDQEEDLEDMHYCAKHVYSDLFGEGVVVEGEHAEPDEDGNIAWYVVEFKDGLRKIPTDKLEIMFAEYHMNHKKKKKMMEDEELDEMSSKMKMKLGLYGKKKKKMMEEGLSFPIEIYQ